MHKYEIMYIVRPDLEAEATEAVIESFNNTLETQGATVEKTDKWGLRELAYDIQKHSKGYYVVLNVEAPGAAIDEFTRLARISEDIIRFITVRDDE